MFNRFTVRGRIARTHITLCNLQRLLALVTSSALTDSSLLRRIIRQLARVHLI